MPKSVLLTHLVPAVFSVLGAASAHAAIVYNSFRAGTTADGILINCDPDETDSRVELPGTPNEREFDSRVGDVITLATTDRFVTQFEIRAWAIGLGGPSALTDIELTIYSVNAGTPSSPLWTGILSAVTLPGSNSPTTLSFAPNIEVPSTIAFGVAFANVTANGRSFGLATQSQSPTVGSSTTGIIAQDTSSGLWQTRFTNPNDLGGSFRQVQARVNAVPIPAPTSAFAIMSGILAATRSLRRRT